MTIKSEYPEFKDRLDEAVRDTYPTDSELLSDYHDFPGCLPSDPAQKKKAQDRLVRLGFRYSDLSAFFEGDE